jgi:phosphoadenosine phosphosulfate reductase
MIDINFPETIFTIEQLNDQFGQLNVESRLILLYEMYDKEEILVTSSFGVDSAMLLHLISKIQPSQQIFFIETGFHFPETIAYKNQLTKKLGLQVIDIEPQHEFHKFTERKRLWENDPDTCCFLNKEMVLESLKPKYKIWVSGLMGHKTEHRSKLWFFGYTRKYDNIIKCCPLLDADEAKSKLYMQKHKLPPHPLKQKGYCSIGCRHCTVKGMGRNGRWAGRDKTECGLHS